MQPKLYDVRVIPSIHQAARQRILIFSFVVVLSVLLGSVSLSLLSYDLAHEFGEGGKEKAKANNSKKENTGITSDCSNVSIYFSHQKIYLQVLNLIPSESVRVEKLWFLELLMWNFLFLFYPFLLRKI